MIFKKKGLPKPFETSFINKIKELKELTKLNRSNNSKNFNLGSDFLFNKRNIDFLEFTNIADKMERMNTIYTFLTNFDNENNIIDLDSYFSSLSKLEGDFNSAKKTLKEDISSMPSEELKEFTLEKSKTFSSILVRPKNIRINYLRKELDKEYRREHKRITRKLKKIRSRSR